jgi:hypothetical protein
VNNALQAAMLLRGARGQGLSTLIDPVDEPAGTFP